MAGRRAPPPSEPPGPPTSVGLWLRVGLWPRVGRWSLAILGASIALVASALVAPWVPFDPTASEASALLAYGIGFACVSGLALVVSALAPSDARIALAAMALAAAALVALVVSAPAPGALPSAVALAALLTLGTAAGAGIGHRIQHAGHLSIVAVVSSVADVASVLAPRGPSHEISESPALLSVLALSWPMIGTARIEPLLGVGDVVFVALYLAAAARHGLSLARSSR